MSYYCPDFGNLISGWYRTTDNDNYAVARKKIDILWDFNCDQILIKYINKYGSFYTAFCSDIKAEIENQVSVSFKGLRYYEYYFQTRAFELPGIKEQLIASYQNIKDKTIQCEVCAAEVKIDEIHPNVIKLQFPPSFCTECSYLTRPYFAEWNEDIRNRVINFLENIDNEKRCDVCKRKYKLKKVELSFQHLYMPIVHVNIYSSICPKCLMKTVFNDLTDVENNQLKKLYNLYEFLGEVPTQDYSSLYFLFKEQNRIIELTKLLHLLWSPDIFKKHFGSFFAALVKSGILPEGTKKMKIGTMVLAKDGHVCLSLAEKDIDDFLYFLNIGHKKEVSYPNSNYRTDWEIVWNQKKYFIEFFGLMNIREYANKAKQKTALAALNNIELISIYPETNWKELIKKIFKL
ncbi:MAG: hypothetical protein HZA10_01730 [Nitrospirae bacterium]|nr:hypothetical protein [Nitrospirota bacterium]